MHTLAAIFGVVANIILALAILSVIIGLVWVAFPLRDKIVLGSEIIYRYYLGGRETGVAILCLGVAGVILGFLLDQWHVRLTRKFGART